MPFEIKIRIMKLGKKQCDLIPELARYGLNVTPPELSIALNGRCQAPKLDKVLSVSNEIVKKWEKDANKA